MTKRRTGLAHTDSRRRQQSLTYRRGAEASRTEPSVKLLALLVPAPTEFLCEAGEPVQSLTRIGLRIWPSGS